MHIQSLLNIEPDKLFEQCSIHEIEDIQKKLLNEIERKREEIRTMVGERYRDLIEAADTISEMKQLSTKVIEDVNKMKIATAELQEQQVSGFRIEYQPKDVKSNPWGCVAVQIKVLIDITEVIWEEVDQGNFTRATLLFLLARYIKTSLEINPNFKTGQHFPIVSRQWISLVHFKDTILQGAEETLKSLQSSQVTCGALVSLALLENLTFDQLLTRYLALQSDVLKAVLASSQSLDAEVIKQRLCDSYTLIVHVIISISHCFVEHVKAKEGLLWKELSSQVGQQAPPTILLLDQITSDIPLSLLPSGIQQFRPVVGQPLVEPLLQTQVHEAISDWLVWVRGLVHDQGGHLLQRLSSLRALQGLREAPLVNEEWLLISQKLVQVPSLDLWNELYRSLITARAQQLVSIHWESAFKAIQLQIRTAFEGACNENKYSEVSIQWHMWKEANSDLNNLNENKSNKGLWLKSRGITPRVAELCGDFERKVCSLLEDLMALCPEQEIDPVLLAISHTLKAHQQTTCAALITKLAHFVSGLAQDSECEAGVLLLAKFLQSVPELCPSLSRCLSSVDAKGVSWQESNLQLQSECLASYQIWHKLARARLLAQFADILKSVVPDLHSIPQWEEISIEEEGESGEKLQSVLKVPSCPSMSLQSALYHLAGVVAHVAVPKHVSELLVDSVIANVIGMYKNSIELQMTQTQFLQMVLDVKYIISLYNTCMSKDLKSQCQDTVARLESKVDPFDLNVFTPYINNNVKTSVQRTQALLGVASVATAPAVTSHRSDEPNVMALSSSASTWFPLLHITAPRTTNTPAKPKGKKSSISASATNTPVDSVSKTSTATSFFGVMATDWFG